MGDIIKGNAALLAWGKITIPELRKKHGPNVVVEIVHACADFLVLDEEIKHWREEGISFW